MLPSILTRKLQPLQGIQSSDAETKLFRNAINVRAMQSSCQGSYKAVQCACDTSGQSSRDQVTYERVSKRFRTGRLERKLQMVKLSATRYSCIAILWVILVSFAAISLCIASQRVIRKVKCTFRYRLSPETLWYTLLEIIFGSRNGIITDGTRRGRNSIQNSIYPPFSCYTPMTCSFHTNRDTARIMGNRYA
jgi:hypothetical protein